jgi:hypothetical protein
MNFKLFVVFHPVTGFLNKCPYPDSSLKIILLTLLRHFVTTGADKNAEFRNYAGIEFIF